jgi:D-alanine-D-alanine ligase
MTRTTIIFDDEDHTAPTSLPGVEARADVLHVVDAVRSALEKLGHAVAVQPVGADFLGALGAVREDAPDAVFNLCESLGGDARGEGVVVGVLEQMGMAVTGSPALALGLALHKDQAKAILRGCGIPTPDWTFLPEDSPVLASPPGYPVIVKPAREDGSIGIGFGSVASDDEGLRQAVQRVWRMHQPALVERFVDGREFCVSFLGNEPRIVLPLREIAFGPSFADRPRIISYLAKWDPSTSEFHDTSSGACDLPPEVQSRMVEFARRTFAVIGCRDYGRVDIRLDADGTPWCIDINPNCDLHPDAGYARAALSAGIDYPSLIATLLENALDRARVRARAPHRPTDRAEPRRSAGSIAPAH